MGRMEHKVAIVTGGALGIGRACATMLAREGAAVVVTDVREDEGTGVAREIEKAGGRAVFVRHDVASEPDWANVMQETRRRFQRVDALVNNAGIGVGGTVEDTTLEQWRRTMAVNLDGVFLGTREAVRAMRETGGGSIVNLSSIEGLVGDPDLAAYNASKGAVRIFTKSAALHCARQGYAIRVNSVHPGYIWTPMVENYLRAKVGDVEAGRRAVAALHPVNRLGEPDDIAYGVLYLASDESRFMTGAELVIDGGYTAR